MNEQVKYATYRWHPDFQRTDDSDCFLADIFDVFAGAWVAEQLLLSNTSGMVFAQFEKDSYDSLLKTFPQYTTQFAPLYANEFLYPAKLLATELQLNGTAKAVLDAAHLYLGTIHDGNVADKLTLLCPLLHKYIQDHTIWVRFTKVWELPNVDESALLISEGLLDQLCVAMWSLMHTESFSECVLQAAALAGYQHKYGNAFRMTGAFAGAYYQCFRIPEARLLPSDAYANMKNKLKRKLES